MSTSLTLKRSSRYLSAKKEMLETILEASRSLRGVRGAASPIARDRMLPPLGAMAEADIDGVCTILSQSLCEVGAKK